MAKRSSQSDFFPKGSSAYGGVLRNKRKGRIGSRSLSMKKSMHLVLRSSKAEGAWSFTKPATAKKIRATVIKHATKNFIRVISFANVGNHLHLHLQLTHRQGYYPFIRAITGAIALAATGGNKHSKIVKTHADRFWDYRPFTRIMMSFRVLLNMKDYMAINRMEGEGQDRVNARLILAQEKDGVRWDYPGGS